MAEPFDNGKKSEQYEETEDPKNPPNSVANDAVRGTALRAYLTPLIALFVVAGIALLYWANRGPVRDDGDATMIGTSGERLPDDAVGERGDESTPGGGNPAPRPDDTQEELERRGLGGPGADLPGLVSENTMTDLRQMAEGDAQTLIGRRIDIADARVSDVNGPTMFSIEKDGARADVIVPAGRPALRDGDSVTVSGVLEPGGRSGVRIRATRVVTE